MSRFNFYLVILGLIMGLQALQIVQPAPKQTTLSLVPDPSVQWVYGNHDPSNFDVQVLQLARSMSSDNATMIQYAVKVGIPINETKVVLPLLANDFQEGMTVNITIMNPFADGNKELASAGPFVLKKYGAYGPPTTAVSSSAYTPSAGIFPNNTSSPVGDVPAENASMIGATNTTSTTADTATSTLQPGLNAPSTSAHHSVSSASASVHTPSSASASAQATPSSAVDQLQSATSLFGFTVLGLVVPFFLLGILM